MLKNGHRAMRWTLTLGLALVALGATSACNDDGVGRSETPTAVWNPQKFVFPQVPQGTREDRIVRIENQGKGDLILANFDPDFSDEFELYWYRGTDDNAEQNFGVVGGQMYLGEGDLKTVRVPSGDSITFVLSYAPITDLGATGHWIMESNDSNHRIIDIEIETADADAEINVNPTTVDFGRVAAEDEGLEDITITNTGTSTLLIGGLSLNGSEDFSVRLGDGDPIQQSDLLRDPDGDGVPGLASGAQFVLKAVYAPPSDGPDAAELTIRSNDPNRGAVIVSLTANGASPCINVTPEALEFPPALVGRTTGRPVSIESCGGEALEITSIRLTDETSDAYTLVADEVAALPLRIAAFVQDEEAPSRNVTINFDPTEEVAYGGKLIIESNDPLRPIIEVPIVGRGTINECPVAEVANDHFESLPLDIVTLDGSNSVDADGPGGKPIEYRWTVTERPAGSTAQPVEDFFNIARPADGGRADNVATPTAQFFVDLAGSYVIELHVADSLDLVAPSEVCQQPAAVITVEAHPDEDIHVQMVWHTPTDPDETDGEGTDVDLHFLHPTGRNWNVAPLDCYWANTNPAWGASLDIDDTNGAGPENINLDDPEFTDELQSLYRVAVEYYRSEDFAGARDWGPSEVTVRIFLGGVLTGEWVQELDRTGNFWEVASIVWTANDRRAPEINRVYPTRP